MPPLQPYTIEGATTDCPSDRELTLLFERVYVDGGFTDADIAKEMFAAKALRDRGHLFIALDLTIQTLIGAAIMVPSGAPSCKLAGPAESELHLLAVLPEYRGMGVGGDLVAVVMQAARSAGLARMMLWSQPSMVSAHRLYQRAGFCRERTRDFHQDGRDFWVFTADL